MSKMKLILTSIFFPLLTFAAQLNYAQTAADEHPLTPIYSPILTTIEGNIISNEEKVIFSDLQDKKSITLKCKFFALNVSGEKLKNRAHYKLCADNHCLPNSTPLTKFDKTFGFAFNAQKIIMIGAEGINFRYVCDISIVKE